MYEYKGRVTNVVDADTVDVTLELGFGIKFSTRLWVDDYDAPETWRPRNEGELTHGTKATQRAKELLLHQDVVIKTTKLGIYGRYGGSIALPDGNDYGTQMIKEGFEKKAHYPETKIIQGLPK